MFPALGDRTPIAAILLCGDVPVFTWGIAGRQLDFAVVAIHFGNLGIGGPFHDLTASQAALGAKLLLEAVHSFLGLHP
jgi:hypothetical protein